MRVNSLLGGGGGSQLFLGRTGCQFFVWAVCLEAVYVFAGVAVDVSSTEISRSLGLGLPNCREYFAGTVAQSRTPFFRPCDVDPLPIWIATPEPTPIG